MLSRQATKFEELAYLSNSYRELERYPAWQDFNSRLLAMRHVVQDEIVRGSLDKFGKDRTDEKRAVFHFLSTVLDIAPAIHEDFERVQKALERRVEQREQVQGRRIEEHVTNWSILKQ